MGLGVARWQTKISPRRKNFVLARPGHTLHQLSLPPGPEEAGKQRGLVWVSVALKGEQEGRP